MGERKLSARLAGDMGLHNWAAEARALEERVAELERMPYDHAVREASLLTRAEAAEADLAATERENERLAAALEAAEAEVARLKAVALSRAEAAVAARDERDALQAKLGRVRAAVVAGDMAKLCKLLERTP